MSIEDLIKFSNEHNIDTAFYYYDFIDEYYFMIDNETTSKFRLDETALSVLQNKIDRHNENLSKLDYDKPANLSDFYDYRYHFYNLKYIYKIVLY